MKTFLQEKCQHTRFPDTDKLFVIYGDADNPNHTKIYEKAYLYTGVGERH